MPDFFDDLDNCPEWLAWQEAMEVMRRWNWPNRHDSKPVPQFVVDEIVRCDAAYQAAKARMEV